MEIAILFATAGLVIGAGLGRWLSRNTWRYPSETGTTTVRPWAAAGSLALAFAVIVSRLGQGPWWPSAVAAMVLATVGLPVIVIDTAVRRVPETMVLTAYVLVLVTLTVGAAAGGQWGSLGRSVAAGTVVWAAAFGYSMVTGTGFGDVQLMGLGGLVLGWVSWSAALLSGPVVLIVGGIWAGVLLLRGHRGTFAFAPPVLLGLLVSVVFYT